MDRIEVAVNAAGPIRTVVHDGREFRVIPAVLVQSPIVLQNNLGRTFLSDVHVTPEWAQQSNDAPVVLDHPTSRGFPVSAKSPEVLNARGLGRVYNVRVENGALKGDVFLDPSRASHVPALNEILTALEAGKPTELSTGFPVSIDETPGVHNGQQYDRKIIPAGPLDHLAVFADKLGACSVKHGCGLGVNHAGDCENEAIPEVPPSVPTTDPEVPQPAANESGDQPQEERSMDREKLIAQLAAAGEDKEALSKLSDCALQALAGQPAQNGDDSEAWKRVRELNAENAELKQRYEPVLENQAKERAKMVEEMLGLSGRTWSDTEIINMGYEDLKKIHKFAFQSRVDYSLARGASLGGQNLLANEVKPFFGTGGVFTSKEA